MRKDRWIPQNSVNFSERKTFFLITKGFFFFLFSLSVPYPTFRPGDPQSAQDKARMDKEYLSLMAELGEAPVPASVGSTSGPATTPLASAPRPAAPANNPPPPVSFRGWFLWPGPPFSSSETGALWPGALGRAGWRTWLATLFFRMSGCLGISRFGKIRPPVLDLLTEPKEQCCHQGEQAGTLAGNALT